MHLQMSEFCVSSYIISVYVFAVSPVLGCTHFCRLEGLFVSVLFNSSDQEPWQFRVDVAFCATDATIPSGLQYKVVRANVSEFDLADVRKKNQGSRN